MLLKNTAPSNSPQGGRLLIAFVCLFILCSCKSTHSIQTVTAVTHDTTYNSQVRYDSIYLDNTVYVDRSGDTVFIRENHMQYKYKFIRDTVYYHQTDTIHQHLTPINQEPEIPPWCKWLTFAGALASTILIILIYKKVATFM